VNLSGRRFNTISANDFSFYEELNAAVQSEPTDWVDPDTVGLYAAIGIRKGQPFAPDARMKRILNESVTVANAIARANLFASRNPRTRLYPDRQWLTPFVGNSYQFLDGGRIYSVTLPGPIPAKNFWAFTVYDKQTRSLLPTDQKRTGLDSTVAALNRNPDGGATVWFGPTPPPGREANWVQTMPGRGYNVLLRLYGPLEPWFSKSWRPGDLQPQR
jgi:hypothetical protein